MNNQKLINALIRQDFSSFIGKAFYTVNPGTKYYTNWHIDLIADYLENVRHGKIKRLIINMPPRALKSLCISVAWPAWLLAHQPASRIMVASYSAILSIKHSLDTRLIIESNWYKNLFPNTNLSKKHNCKNKFLTTQNGFRFATSVGGSATGEGGDYLIVDDPHNPTQIHSTKLRNKAVDWFENTFLTRLDNRKTGAVIIVMQRLHENDLSSQLLASGNWELLKIPILAYKNLSFRVGCKSYQFKKNNILTPARDNKESLSKIEKEVGTRNFSAQFLQQPLPSNYNLLSKQDISFYNEIPEHFNYYIYSWDTAIKTNDTSDFSVGICFGITDNKYYLLSVIRKKLDYPNLKQTIERLATRYLAKYILIEDQASGQSIIQDLKNSGHTNIKAIKPKFDKITRFASVVNIFQSGKIMLPMNSTFNHILLKEITNFPNSKHDDIVDSISQFLNFMKTNYQKRAIRIRGL